MSGAAPLETVNVRIVQRGQVLGEEAVAKSSIAAGMPVIDEAPMLVLPHQDLDVAPSAAVSPAALLRATLERKASAQAKKKEEAEGDDKKDDDDGDKRKSSSSSGESASQQIFAAALREYSETVQPALEKAEAIAKQHGLALAYYAPLVMAHYTMSRAEIKEIVRWLVSHVDDGGDAASKQQRQHQHQSFGFEPLQLIDRELNSGTAVLNSLSSLLAPPASSSSSASNASGAAALPTAEFWLQEVFSSSSGGGGKKQSAAASSSSNAVTATTTRALLKWLHGVRINVHSDDVHRLTAVFRHACKFNHSCSPNTFWFLSSSVAAQHDADREQHEALAARRFAHEAGVAGVVLPQLRAALKQLIGNAVHVASRDIAKDEPTTFSYVGCGLNLLSPALQRRHSLSHLHFVCECQRCADFDRGAKPELALRGIICGECFARAAKSPPPPPPGQQSSPPQPQPSDFLTTVLIPATTTNTPGGGGGGGWRCIKCGYEPAYEDLSESLLHEAVHVDMLMGTFFNNKAAAAAVQQAGDGDASSPTKAGGPKNLAVLFACLQRVVRQLTHRHYIAAVGTTSFVSHLVLQLKRGATDFATLQRTVFADGAGAATGFFVAAATQTMVWYAATMKGSPQHVRFMIALAELVDMLASIQQRRQRAAESNSAKGKSEGEAAAAVAEIPKPFLSPDEVAALGSLVQTFARGEGFRRLVRFPDMHL